MARPGATDAVRQELARLEVTDPAAAVVELGALLRAAGTLHRTGAGTSLELASTTGAVVRRAHRLLQLLGVQPTLWVRDATNVARRTYGVALGTATSAEVGVRTGVLDDAGRPAAVAPDRHLDHAVDVVRGALLGAGSVSAPGRAPHLELRTARLATAEQLATLVARIVGVRPSVGTTAAGHRAALKSGAAVGDLLGALGATDAYLAHDEQRLRRQVRGEAQRLANADAANVRRAVRAAASQVATAEAAVAAVGWDGLPEDLREVALARLANPAASLTELGELCDPPVGKSAVHRRLGRLREVSQGEQDV